MKMPEAFCIVTAILGAIALIVTGHGAWLLGLLVIALLALDGFI